MLDEFHRTSFKEQALEAEGQREKKGERKDGERRESCACRER